MTSLVVLSSLIGLCSSNWLIVWISLELNTLSICLIISNECNNENKEEIITSNYYFIQIFTSLIILASSSTETNYWCSITIIVAIISNIGIWPIQNWYINLINLIEINNPIIIVTTWQKILPTFIIVTINNNEVLQPILVITIFSLLAPLTNLNLSLSINKILALSSINSNSWLILTCIVSPYCGFLFLAFYSSTLIITLNAFQEINNNNTETINNPWESSTILINIAGIPPITIFWINLIVISNSINSFIDNETLLIFILSACIIAYAYISTLINETNNTPTNNQIEINYNNNNFTILSIITLSTLSTIIILDYTQKGLPWWGNAHNV